MGITAKKLLKLKIVDQVIKEPVGGAHRNPLEAAELLKAALTAELQRLQKFSTQELLDQRYAKMMDYGAVELRA